MLAQVVSTHPVYMQTRLSRDATVSVLPLTLWWYIQSMTHFPQARILPAQFSMFIIITRKLGGPEDEAIQDLHSLVFNLYVQLKN